MINPCYTVCIVVLSFSFKFYILFIVRIEISKKNYVFFKAISITLFFKVFAESTLMLSGPLFDFQWFVKIYSSLLLILNFVSKIFLYSLLCVTLSSLEYIKGSLLRSATFTVVFFFICNRVVLVIQAILL